MVGIPGDYVDVGVGRYRPDHDADGS
jgi:hypothetical protein